METNCRDGRRVCNILLLCLTMAAIFISHCDARRSNVGVTRKDKSKHSRSTSSSMVFKAMKIFSVMKHIDGDLSSNTRSYGVSSPNSLPPFDSLAPFPLPENAPPYCVNPPFTPQPPSTAVPTPTGGYTPTTPYPYISPILPIENPPPSPIGTLPSPSGSFPTPNPPESFPSPPGAVPSPFIYFPNPPGAVPSPFIYFPSPPGPILTPPYYEPSPPSYVPSPTGFVPSPPLFEPPVVFPPPIGHPPPSRGPSMALWCVAKPSVPDPIIQEAMNYACGSGADCATIQESGPCFEPNTVYAHASYAFNSYWQRTKVAGGTCSFGGTAMLVTVDPSHDGCHFVYN